MKSQEIYYHNHKYDLVFNFPYQLYTNNNKTLIIILKYSLKKKQKKQQTKHTKCQSDIENFER